MQNRILILSLIAVILVLGGLLYIYNPEPFEYKNPKEEKPVFCTMDAKLCPDGSYVGRIPPNCEFAACPTGNGTIIPPGTVFEDGTLNPENP